MEWVIENPLKSTCAVLTGVPILDFYLRRKAKKEFYSPVVEKLSKGSKPSTIGQNTIIPCPEVSSYLTRMFLPEVLGKSTGTRFGVIIGPSGSGKTFAVREVCNSNPEGVL